MLGSIRFFLESMLKKKEVRTGTIEKTIFGGDGLIKIDDFAIIIKNGIEGQKVEYEVTKLKKNYAQASITKILEKSPLEIPKIERKNALPGCAYQNISYENQLEIKHKQLKEIFRNFEETKIPKIVASPHIYAYRNKMEFSCGYESMTSEFIDGKKIWKDEGFALGFHPPKCWAEVISIPDVFIASGDINFLRTEIEQYLKTQQNLLPWNALNCTGFWRGIIFRHCEKNKEITINFIVNQAKDENFWAPVLQFLHSLELLEYKISGIFQSVHTGKSDAIVNPEVTVLWGKETLEEELSFLKNSEKKESFSFEISPFSFFQTNTRGAEVLYSTIREFLGKTEGKNVLDLFCGTGSIGIFCAPKAKKVVGVELIEEAVEMARKNAEKNSIKNAEFFAGKAEKLLPEILEKFSFDTVIIDPPRAGMHPKALQYVANLPVKKLVYVSCNPTTLARDAQTLTQAQGWKLKTVQGVDMFPHTPHMECVSILERG